MLIKYTSRREQLDEHNEHKPYLIVINCLKNAT